MHHDPDLPRRSMSAFEIYLRTGIRLRSPDAAQAPDFKFNPWHDPENGRFTFRNAGRYYSGNDPFGGYGGGGDGFNGGGASGGWDEPAERKPNSAPKPKQTLPAPTQKPVTFRKNGYRFDIDANRRTTLAEGPLAAGPNAGRSRSLQRRAGGDDREQRDDGGHYIAPRFNGPKEWFNHFAQDRNFNRGAYRELERQWGKDVAAGRKVFVTIIPAYRGESNRPSSIAVYWTVRGQKKMQIFRNEHGGGKHGG